MVSTPPGIHCLVDCHHGKCLRDSVSVLSVHQALLFMWYHLTLPIVPVSGLVTLHSALSAYIRPGQRFIAGLWLLLGPHQTLHRLHA